MDQEPLERINVLTLVSIFLVLFFVRYLSYRCQKFMAVLCPNQKMCCIGLRARNMLTLTHSCNLAASWSTVLALDVLLVCAFRKYQHLFEPDVAFLLHNMLWFLSCEGHNIVMIYLSRKEIPFVQETVPRPQFYQKHMILEPRRAKVPNSRMNIFKQLLKDKTIWDKEVLQISQGIQPGGYRTRMPCYSTRYSPSSTEPSPLAYVEC